MPFRITFSPTGNWTGGARIPPELQNMENLSQWIKSFLTIFTDLWDFYFKYLHNDGKLIGQEKANLAERLEDLIGGLFLFRQYILPEAGDEFEAIDKKLEFWFQIKLNYAAWQGHGKISQESGSNLTEFGEWYKEVILHKIKEMFQQYSQALADNVLTKKESQGLVRFIDMVVSDFLLIERMLMTSGLNR